MPEKVGLPFGLVTEATFLGYEPRGISVRADKAQGSMIVTPEQAFQGALETGDKVLLSYEVRYVTAQRGQGFQTQAGIRVVLVSVEKIDKAVGAGGKQANLVSSPEGRK